MKIIWPTDTPTLPFELAHVARLRNGYQLPHDDEFNRSVIQLINGIQKNTGATKHLLIIREDWETIMKGEDRWNQVKSLSKIQIKPVNITDIFFENGAFRTVELALKR